MAVTRSVYDDLKSSYLAKNRNLHSLYVEINRQAEVDRHSFFRLINKIRQEEGLNEYYTFKKQKKRNDIIEIADKSPNHYN